MHENEPEIGIRLQEFRKCLSMELVVAKIE